MPRDRVTFQGYPPSAPPAVGLAEGSRHPVQPQYRRAGHPLAWPAAAAAWNSAEQRGGGAEGIGAGVEPERVARSAAHGSERERDCPRPGRGDGPHLIRWAGVWGLDELAARARKERAGCGARLVALCPEGAVRAV